MKNDIIIFFAKYLVYILVLVALVYWFRLNRNRKLQLAGSVIIAAVLSAIGIKIASKLYYHPRPFVSEHIKPLISHSADNGFPSDHATFAMAITTCVYFFNLKVGRILLAISVLVGLGRIWSHVHSPVDIAAGMLIGIAAACLGYWLSKRFLAKNES